MKRSIYAALAVIVLLSVQCSNEFKPVNEKINYPKSAKVDQADTYFGKTILDPYRWLENDTSVETAAWVAEQNKVTNAYLEKIPFREDIRKRLEAMWNFPKQSVPFMKKQWLFFEKNEGMQNQSVLFVQEGMSGTPRILIDPNTLSKDGTVSLGGYTISNDGKYMAYILNQAGSDWSSIEVLEIATGKKLADKIDWVKFSGASWKADGFYYSRYDAPKKGEELSSKNEYHKVYYHKIGDPQDKDMLVYENKNYPLRNYYAYVTDDERFLVMSESESTHGNALYVKDLTLPVVPFIKIADGFKFEYNIIDNDGKYLYMMTNDGAPKNKLVKIDFDKPARENWETVIAEQNDVLESVSAAGDKFVVQYMRDASNRLFLYNYNGKMHKMIALPTLGTVTSANGEKGNNTLFFGFTSFTYPTTIYKFDIAQGTEDVFYRPDIDFDGSKYEVKQVFYKSKDETKIPMFIVHKKGLKMNGKNPTLLYGYGGFNISLTPSFSISRLLLLENGGVLAIANLRGGGEYGEDWHAAGTVFRKQNVFNDFIAAAEYLITEKYTSTPRLAIQGGSNGGLLVGACMTQRPDLFGVCLPAVGVMDMLRYHKFTIGWAWASDYGTSEDTAQFENLLRYSPLHNIKGNTCYPATLVTTADHDDRVVPAHSFKFAATLQERQACNNPVLIRIETKAGHGGGKPTAKVIEELTDVYSFMFYNFGIKPKK